MGLYESMKSYRTLSCSSLFDEDCTLQWEVQIRSISEKRVKMSLYCDEDHITVTFGDEVYNLQVKQILHYGDDISRVFNSIDYNFNFSLIHKRGTMEYRETLKFNIEDREYSVPITSSVWLKEMRKCIDWYLLNKLSSA